MDRKTYSCPTCGLRAALIGKTITYESGKICARSGLPGACERLLRVIEEPRLAPAP